MGALAGVLLMAFGGYAVVGAVEMVFMMVTEVMWLLVVLVWLLLVVLMVLVVLMLFLLCRRRRL